MKGTLGLAAAALVLLGGESAVFARAEVTALAEGSNPVEATDELRLSRFADFSEKTTVTVGTVLEVGDLLSSASETIGVELGCGEAVLRFSGGFRLLVNGPEAGDCAVDLLSGTIDLLTDTPAEIGAGNVTLGVEGTQLSLSLTRTEAGPEEDLAVFEGRVRVLAGSIDAEVETGRSWKHAGGEQLWGEVSDAKSERSAALFARLDVAKSVASGEEVGDREQSYENLKKLYLEVLKKPTDAENRVALARAQLAIQRDAYAAYHLKRADVTTEEQLESYGIDRRVLSSIAKKGLSPKVAYPQSSSGATGSSRARDPFELIERGAYEEAIELLQERGATEGRTSKIYYGLALAESRRQGGSEITSAAYCSRALEVGASDRELSREEALWCRRVKAAGGV